MRPPSPTAWLAMSADTRPAPDREALVAMMVAGFHDDPLYTWLYPDPDLRPRQLAPGFELMLELGEARGDVRATPDASGVAIWTWPGQVLLDDDAEGRFAALLREHAAERADDAVAGMASLAAHEPTGPHATLHNICVDPRARSRGVGRSLLEPMLARCDADGIVASLDSSTSRNVPFYERLGFEVVAEVVTPGGGPIIRPMHRQPRRSGAG